MKRVTLLVLLTLMFSPSATAQFHTIFHFSVPEGLPSSEVYEVYQDRKGFLWFATDNGVARYDGKEFELFHIKDGLTDPVVFSFFDDAKGRIWLRSFSGRLCYLDGDKFEAYPYNNELIKIGQYPFFNFAYDSKSNALRFTLAHVTGRIDENGQVYTQEAPKRSSLIQSIDGQLLQGTDIRFSVDNIIINDQAYPIELTDTTEHKFFNSIACGEKIYVSIYKDLFEYYRNTVKRILTAKRPIISLSKDRSENLWIGYLNEGVENYIDAKRRWAPGFLKNKSVTKVFQDASSGYWFTTLESGVYHVPTFEIENYTLPTTSRIKTVLSLGDTVLIGDQGGTLFFLDAHARKLRSEKTYQDEVYALYQDSDRNIWVSAGKNVTLYDQALKTKSLYSEVATSFSEDRQGFVWAYGGIRITQFDKTGRVIKWDTRRINYRTFLVDDSVIYFAGRTGLHVRDKEMNLKEEPPAFSKYKITQIEFLNDTILLLATQGNGLLLVDKIKWAYRQFDTRHRFLANNIYCMKKTDSTLWIGTEKGLVAIDLQKLLKNELNFYHLSQRTGLIADKIDFILPVRGNIWAFADNSFSIIPESSAASHSSSPIFYIKKIIAGVDTITNTNALTVIPIRLSNNSNHLTLTFGYISLSNQDIFLRYRISPESEWILTNERTLQFLSLAPGSYHFELEYSVDNIKWSPTFAALPFSIDVPWWLRWYSLAGALAFILLLGYVYLKYRHSIYKQKNHYLSIINTHQQKLLQSEVETLERERNRIARELHDGVGTNLTAIKLMVNQLLQQYDSPQAGDVEEQFQIALRELKDIIYGLTPPSLARYGLFTALKNYVSKLNKSFSPAISIQIFGEEINNFEFNIMVFRIVQELLANSIKHSSAQSITVHINAFDDVLNIVYEDDGVGFSYRTQRQGLGLDNIESRIQSVNGTLKFDSGDHGIFYTIDIPLNTIRETAR